MSSLHESERPSRLHARLRPPGFADLGIFLSFFALIGVPFVDSVNDPGLGWHLRTGEWIVANLRIPASDPFLGAPLDRPWVCDQWLGDVFLWLVYTLGGWTALAAIPLFTFLGLYWGWGFNAMRASGMPVLAAFLIAIFALKLGQIHFIVRPIILAFPLFALVLSRTLLRGARPIGGAWRTFGIFCLWANLHPSFVLGLVVLGAGLVGGPSRQNRLRHLIGAALGTLVNPRGPLLHLSILQLGGSDFFSHLHVEWRPLEPWSFEASCAAVLLAVSVLSFRLGASRGGARVSAITLVFVFFALGFRSVRFAPFLSLIGCAVCAVHGAWSRVDAGPLGAKFLAIHRYETQSARGAWGVFAALCMLIIECSGSSGLRVEPDAARYPIRLLERVCAASGTLPRNDAVAVSSPDWGGVVTFVCRGRLRAFIDDRNTMNGEDRYRRYLAASHDEAALARLADELDAGFVLWPARTPLRTGRFEVFDRDEGAILYRVLR